MIRQDNDVIKRIAPELNRFIFPFLFILIFLATSACTLGSINSDAVAIVKRLPTLTRTPFPTLTPTSMAMVNIGDGVVSVPLQQQGAGVEVSDPVQNQTASGAENASPIENQPNLVDNTPQVATQNSASVDQPVVVAQAPVDMPTSTPIPPTDAPTSLPTETPTPLPTNAPTPLPTATETPLPQGWVFNGVQAYTGRSVDGLLLYGDLINNTGVAQELMNITGTFYDGAGQVAAGADRTSAYWPGYVLPQGKSMPFELIVENLDNAANFDLSVEAEPSSETVQYDFEFLGLNQWIENNSYCLEGQVRSLGADVQDYLTIAVILYDAQDHVVQYGDYQDFGRVGLVGGQTASFNICVDSFAEGVAHHKLQAWGW